jgi:phosphodiesterase/alkaline phosphatase D-like protein
MAKRFSRRTFIRTSATLTSSVAAACGQPAAAAASSASDFVCRWASTPDRVWVGPEFWTNPLQDWRIAGGRLECTRAAPDRSVHLLVRQLGASAGDVQMSVRLGRLDAAALNGGGGSAGFRVGARGPLGDYRNNLIFGTGLDAGITHEGRLFIGHPGMADTSARPLAGAAVELRLAVTPRASGYAVVLSAHEVTSGARLAEVRRDRVAADRLIGNLALVANVPPARPPGRNRSKAADGAGAGRFWFADWRVGGSKVEAHDDRAFGPILFSQYTLSRGTLKLTAQMPPMGNDDEPLVRLQVRRDGAWREVGRERMHPEARTATFRVDRWNAAEDTAYRLVYTLRATDGTRSEHSWAGTVRRDPVDQDVLSVADISCNSHAAFPNAWCVQSVARLNPDLLAFTGDQFYESSGGYGVQRAPLDAAILDLLRKWYLHGWTWRELTRDRPSVSIPDDHDIYQGNVWGEAGGPRHGTQEMGGYEMPPEWVNVVHRAQTAHHPDPFDATPVKRGISVYYGPLTYGRVSFGILADRQFKSGPEGKVPATGSRGDHVIDPAFDPGSADLPGLELLGERQLEFLRSWVADWRGADMKAVISQTIFTAMATTHGVRRERLRADYDANGWPQAARNAALREMRKALAFHLAGDQHLPAVIHYGIDAHRDAGLAFAGPAVNSIYPRWFEPDAPGENRQPDGADNTGDFRDHFGHPLTVLAVANPARNARKTVLEQELDRAAGLGIVRFNKRRRTITIECWPILSDVAAAGTQFAGWPVTVSMMDNDGRRPVAYLPKLEIAGVDGPLVQVIDEATGELLYNLRIAGQSVQPHVFAQGRYTVCVRDAESERARTITGLAALPENHESLAVEL